MNSKVVFITGGAAGIGFETGRRLAHQGYRVVLVDRAGDQAVAAAKQLGPEHLGLAADVTDLASLEAAARATIDAYGRIDVVIANAGVGSASTVRSTPADTLLRILDINLLGQVRTVKATLEHVIAQRGLVMFTCSAAVLKHTPRSSAYAASKAGVDAFAGALRLEVAHHGVDVGVIYPGWTKTAMTTTPGSRAAATSKGMPWPLNITSDVDKVADAYTTAVIRRARTTYVPRIHRFVHWIRPFYTGPFWDRTQRAAAKRNVQAWEADFVPGEGGPRPANGEQ